jgi:hypothetical protein
MEIKGKETEGGVLYRTWDFNYFIVIREENLCLYSLNLCDPSLPTKLTTDEWVKEM